MYDEQCSACSLVRLGWRARPDDDAAPAAQRPRAVRVAVTVHAVAVEVDDEAGRSGSGRRGEQVVRGRRSRRVGVPRRQAIDAGRRQRSRFGRGRAACRGEQLQPQAQAVVRLGLGDAESGGHLAAVEPPEVRQLQRVAQAQGDAAQFEQIYRQYRLAPDVTRRRLYYETMEQILSNVDKTIVETPGAVTPYLPLPQLQQRARPAPAAPASAP